LRLSVGGAGGTGGGGGGAGSSTGGIRAVCGSAAGGAEGAGSSCRSASAATAMIPAANTGPKANKIHFCLGGTLASARWRGQCRRPQPLSADITREIRPSMAALSIQRSTATIPAVGSIQVELTPAPLAKMLSGEALAYRSRLVLSHQR